MPPKLKVYCKSSINLTSQKNLVTYKAKNALYAKRYTVVRSIIAYFESYQVLVYL